MTTDTYSGKMYAVVAGDYGGSYLIVVDQTVNNVNCLRLPQQSKMSINISDFTRGVNNKIVNEVACIDKSVYTYCKQIYEKISNN
jgi:hypothetical protein